MARLDKWWFFDRSLEYCVGNGFLKRVKVAVDRFRPVGCWKLGSKIFSYTTCKVAEKTFSPRQHLVVEIIPITVETVVQVRFVLGPDVYCV